MKNFAYLYGEDKLMHIASKARLDESSITMHKTPIGITETDVPNYEGGPSAKYKGEDVVVYVTYDNYMKGKAVINGLMGQEYGDTVTRKVSQIQSKPVPLSDFPEIKALYEKVLEKAEKENNSEI